MDNFNCSSSDFVIARSKLDAQVDVTREVEVDFPVLLDVLCNDEDEVEVPDDVEVEVDDEAEFIDAKVTGTL